eukprot:GFUD01061616.1.p1 GENE.GFUD01061616.1~~GFUD01061616.1.p1  ORF type:complete len:228 (+),score=56.03 GFUD01061616.1:44-727(+)
MDSPRHNSCRPIYALLAIALTWIFWPVLAPAMLGLDYIVFQPFYLLIIFCSTISETILFVTSLGCFGFLIKDVYFKYGHNSSVLKTSVGGNSTPAMKIPETEEDGSEEVTRPVDGNDDQEETASEEAQNVTEEVLKDLEEVQNVTEEVLKDLEEVQNMTEEVLKDIEEVENVTQEVNKGLEEETAQISNIDKITEPKFTIQESLRDIIDDAVRRPDVDAAELAASAC